MSDNVGIDHLVWASCCWRDLEINSRVPYAYECLLQLASVAAFVVAAPAVEVVVTVALEANAYVALVVFVETVVVATAGIAGEPSYPPFALND